MRGITLQRLQVFCEVYERSSISAAARSLGLSQPTVSRHLRDFEASTTLQLFVLDRGRVWPTSEADAMYRQSRFLKDGINRLETQIADLQDGAGSKLSVMSVGMLMPDYVSIALSQVLSRMPRLRVTVDLATAERQLAHIRSGRVDLGIMAGHVETVDEKVTAIGHGRLVALLPGTHALARCETIRLADMAETVAVDSTARGPIGRILDAAMRREGLSMTGSVICGSLAAVPHMVRALNRPAIVDAFTARSNAGNGLVRRPIDPDISFPILAVSLSPSGSRVAIDQMTDAVRALFEGQCRGDGAA